MDDLEFLTHPNRDPSGAAIIRHLQEAQHVAGVGSWVWDVLTNDLWFSDELYRIFAREPGSIRTVEDFIAPLAPDRREVFLQHLEHSVRTKTPLAYDTTILLGDGSIRWIRGKGKVYLDGEGRMVAMMATVMDITELKAAEAEIESKAAALEEANAALTRQTALLEAQHEELQHLDRMKDQFLSMLSHELRSPLTTIEGVLSLLERPGVDVEAYHRRIGLATRSLTSLVSDLLSAAQLQSGRFELTNRPFQPELLLEDAFDEVESLAQAKGVMLRRSVEGPLPEMTGARQRLLQVLRNLLINAVRHTPEAGEVSLRARVAGDRLQIEVADTGDGMDAAARARLFERFASSADGGVGLGLFVVKELVEAHGGRVVVESERGVGSTFTVALPL